MKMFTEPARRIPVYAEVDVLVVGGGAAGAAAAVASARLGADTLLVERQAYLGGSVTASLTGIINGFRNQKQPNLLQSVRGIPQEIILQLNRMGGVAPAPCEQDIFDLSLGQLSYAYAADVEKLKVLLMKMADEAHCDVLLHTYATAPILDSNRMLGVIVENKSGRQALFAKAVVDCTAGADIGHRAGAICHNIPGSVSGRTAPMLMYKVAGFRPEQNLPFPGLVVNGSLLVSGPAVSVRGINAIDVSRGEIEARTRVLEHFEQLRRAHPGLENAFVVQTAPKLGFKRTRYVQGEYVLTERDALAGTRFPDVIAISSAPIQNYYETARYLDHEGFDVPYRCILPVRIDGLLVAGAAISCEPQPYESLSSTACVMAMGQAAGAAAAIAADRNILPRQINVIELQQALLRQGAELRRGA